MGQQYIVGNRKGKEEEGERQKREEKVGKKGSKEQFKGTY